MKLFRSMPVAVFASFLSLAAFGIPSVLAFNGPSYSAGVGSGAIGVDTYNDVSIGTSTPNSAARFLVVASSTSPYSFEIMNAASTPIFTIDNNGVASIAGTVTASAFVGALNGTVSAANISSGQFGSNTGGGNYSFPGNVGIGTTTPLAPLQVASGSVLFGATPTTLGAFFYKPAGNNSFFGIYNSNNALYFGISAQLPSPSGASTLGGYYKGLGIGGATANTGNPIFGVLNSSQHGNGIGNTAFTIMDNNNVDTYNNILDNGSGGAGFHGNVSIGTTTIGAATLYVAGNVGIGTTTPSVPLTVSGNALVTGTLTAGAFSGPIAGTESASNISAGSFGSNTGGGNYSFPGVVTFSGTGSVFNVNNNVSFSAQNSAGTSENYFWPRGSDNIMYMNYGSAGFNIRNDSSVSTMFMANGGNVGIGTTAPAYKLDVQGGQINSSGGYCINGANCITSWPTGSFTGSGTANYIPLFASSTALGNSAIYQSGSNIGIGTTAPNAAFEVANGQISFTNSATDGYGQLYDDGSVHLAADNTSNQVMVLSSPNGIYLRPTVGGTSVSYFSTTGGSSYINGTGGNVGIGTTAPYAQFQVHTGTNQNLNVSGPRTLSAGTSLWSANDANNAYVPLSIEASLVAIPYGNVGIGTTAPAYTLDVNGAGNFNGYVVHNVGTPVVSTDAANKSYVDTAVASGVNGGISGTANYLPVFTGTNTLGNSAIYQSGGNVGIGTTAPATILDIGGGINYINQNATYQMVPTTAKTIQVRDVNNAALNLVSDANTDGAILGAMMFSRSGGQSDAHYNVAGVQATEVGTGAYAGAKLNFYTKPNGSGYTAPRMTIDSSGNVGIGTTAPAYTLDVNGAGNFNGNVVHGVGTPIVSTDAANKSYVDTAVAGGGGSGSFSTLTVSGAVSFGAGLNFTGGSGATITGLSKITVGTVDPVYAIGGIKYATFGPSMANGVTEEVEATGTLAKASSGGDYEYAIDFAKLAQGSPLWLWYQAVDFGQSTVEALATPYGRFAEIYYTIDGTTLTFHGTAPAEFTFRLTGNRFDWKQWPIKVADQSEQAGFVLTPKE